MRYHPTRDDWRSVAPESSDAARGAGSHVTWIDPEHDLVAVVRWIDKASLDGCLGLVIKSVES